jgi:hypothetical protein
VVTYPNGMKVTVGTLSKAISVARLNKGDELSAELDAKGDALSEKLDAKGDAIGEAADDLSDEAKADLAEASAATDVVPET